MNNTVNIITSSSLQHLASKLYGELMYE